MIITVAIDNGDDTAQIDGFEDRDPGGRFTAVEGYVYVPGMYDGKTYYCKKVNDVWKAVPRPAFHVLPGERNVTAGEEMVFTLKEAGVTITIDGEHAGVNEDKTVEFTPENAGVYTVEFTKFPFQDLKVIVNAS